MDGLSGVTATAGSSELQRTCCRAQPSPSSKMAKPLGKGKGKAMPSSERSKATE